MFYVQLQFRYNYRGTLVYFVVCLSPCFVCLALVLCAGTFALRVQSTDPRCRSRSFFQLFVTAARSPILIASFSSRNAPYYKLDPSVALAQDPRDDNNVVEVPG